MWELDGLIRHYSWGHETALPEMFGAAPDGQPWAESWYGAHPVGPSTVRELGVGLDAAIRGDSLRILGDGVHRAFGGRLPYLLKLIAPGRPLSLQVHPTREYAAESFAAENAAGIPLDSEDRNYRDDNHKPEMVLALERFEAVCGFRTPRRAAAIVEGLGTETTDRLHRLLVENPDAHGMRAAFRTLVSPHMKPSPEEVGEVADACAARLERGGSPSPRIDRIVGTMQRHFPGDSGVVAALLLNPVTLQPGEAMFVPAGAIHAYISGFAVEIMAASDNVLRAGLTPKRIDTNEMLQCVSVTAAPPLRVAPEHLSTATEAYFAPIDEFELSVTTVDDGEGSFQPKHLIPGSGPRIMLGIDGDLLLSSGIGRRRIRRGQALFVPAYAGELRVGGCGRLVQASVP